MGGARCYVTLFEAPFQASVLNDSKNNALRASSLMAIPPSPHGSQPLAWSTAVDLMGNNLTQWASDVQEVASYMRWPPEAAVRCPLVDMIGVLNRLEGLTRVRYCRSCFGVGLGCQCSAVPHQVSGPMAALWAPPTLSYLAMVSSTETTASTSTAGVTYRLEIPLSSSWTRCHLSLRRTCWQLLVSAGAANHRPRRAYQQLLVSVRQDLRCLNSRCLLQEGGKRRRQHLIGNRCSHLNPLPPSRAPPPVPAGIKEALLERLEVPGVGPHPGGLRKGGEGAGPPREDLGSATGLIPMTV